MLPDSKCGLFLSCLHFAIIDSVYSNICLKPKQVICLEYIFLGKDVLAILPTGYGKSLVFHLLPPLLTHKYKQQTSTKESLQGMNKEILRKIIIVVSPLDSLINDQIYRLASSGLQSSVLSVSWKYIGDEECPEAEINLRSGHKAKLESALYDVVFAHPESFISCKYGRNLLQSKIYQEKIGAIVVDEAHCILDWLVL